MWIHHTVKQNNYKNEKTLKMNTLCWSQYTNRHTHSHTVELKKVPLLAAGGAGQWVCVAGQDAV